MAFIAKLSVATQGKHQEAVVEAKSASKHDESTKQSVLTRQVHCREFWVLAKVDLEDAIRLDV